MQERAWYDANRGTVLDSGLPRQTPEQHTTASPFSDLMLQEHQTPTAFSAFDDSSKGFYSVFSTLFSALHSQEEAAAEASTEKLPVAPAPIFGASDASDSVFKEFYVHWTSFQTVKDFAWLDKHDPQSGTGRHMRRVLEAENGKARKVGKLAFVKEVRSLVEWVRSQDPRVRRARVRWPPLRYHAAPDIVSDLWLPHARMAFIGGFATGCARAYVMPLSRWWPEKRCVLCCIIHVCTVK